MTEALFFTTEPGDFKQMVSTGRFALRSEAMQTLVSHSETHYWDPTDPAYLDLSPSFDISTAYVLSEDLAPELSTRLCAGWQEPRRIALANDLAHYELSQLLYGEQGALSLTNALCGILYDPGAQEFSANQVREEARHVHGLGRYIDRRWGLPAPIHPELLDLLSGIVQSRDVNKMLVAMQLVIEGFAFGAFALLSRRAGDPVLARLSQLILSDEVVHHRFGQVWADATVPDHDEETRAMLEDLAAACFRTVLMAVHAPQSKAPVYARHGIDPDDMQRALQEPGPTELGRAQMRRRDNPYRILARSISRAGLITAATRHVYEPWVDLTEIEADTTPEEDDPAHQEAEAAHNALVKINNAARRRHRTT